MNTFFKASIILILSLSTVLAYSDRDFDGVSDALDQCPQSSMEDIVDETGCRFKNTLSVGLGESISSGTYGGTDTITTYNTNLIFGYQINKWYISTAFSYFSSGPADPSITTIEDSKGFGDTYVNAGYTYSFGKKDAYTLSALGSIKFATADTTIGTGEMDYSFALSSTYTNNRFTLLASAGYSVTGDTILVTYNDIKNYSVGAGYMMNTKNYASISYAYADAYFDTSVATQTLSLFSSYLYNESYSLSISYALGLSDAAADHALSVMLTRKFK